MLLFDKIDIRIHPMWEMEDKAMISLLEVILNWEITPISMEMILNTIKDFHVMFFIRMNSGVIFCHVSNRARLSQEILFAIGGNQVWKGATATLMNRAIEITVEHIIMIIFILILISFVMNPSSKIVDAADWIRKYFIALSLIQLFFFLWLWLW